jgi:hypothetical protein
MRNGRAAEAGTETGGEQKPPTPPQDKPNPDKRPKLEEMLREANALSAANRLSKGGKRR